MNTKQLFIALAFIGVWFVGITSAGAAAISFSEDPAGTTPIVVNTDIAGATIATSVESATLSVGNVTGPSTLLLKRAMTNMGTMTGEGGGAGVSDVLEIDSFVSSAMTVGFLATFLSDPDTTPETGIPTPSGLTLPNILENGSLQTLTPDGFSAMLPGVGSVPLVIMARSDAVEGPEGVPEPSTLMLMGAALFGFGVIWLQGRLLSSRRGRRRPVRGCHG